MKTFYYFIPFIIVDTIALIWAINEYKNRRGESEMIMPTVIIAINVLIVVFIFIGMAIIGVFKLMGLE